MYASMWRRLPGSTSIRAAAVIVLTVAVLAALWYVVFPWAASHLPIDGGGVSG